MLRIQCPFCGERDYTEFRYGGDAHRERPAHGSTDRKAWYDYVFLFDNPKGRHREYWQHVLGCRQWLVLERSTATNQTGPSWAARDAVRTAEPGAIGESGSVGEAATTQ
jgi:heterotetrameric sarcosine oxidase delta subunit